MDIIEDAAQQGIQKIGLEAEKILNKIPGINQDTKDNIALLKDNVIDKVTPAVEKIFHRTPRNSLDRPRMKDGLERSQDSIKDSLPVMKKLPFKDKFKNFLAKIHNATSYKAGLGPQAHIITKNDYTWNPDKKKHEFTWKKANDNDGYKRDVTVFRPGQLINTVGSIAKKIK